ncbi:hypothetical protein [Sporisorium scitamineum]|uniref:Uncharacterized protein n=1 Tax=Sporisorium scitamineum TaxID=49012 RepID=A0A0F7SD95_9BASI|nr:hypothetical protein [Sporisorium scitamineum]
MASSTPQCQPATLERLYHVRSLCLRRQHQRDVDIQQHRPQQHLRSLDQEQRATREGAKMSNDVEKRIDGKVLCSEGGERT